MHTYFAPAERASDEALQHDIEQVSTHPVVAGLMNVVVGLLAVLNEQRQILALNKAFLEMLGLDNVGEVLGLRPGEAIQCVHAHDHPGGCGTTEFCSTCGAALAIVASLAQDRPVSRTCAVVVDQAGIERDLYLRVHACPIWINARRLLLLFLQDVTREQQWAALERTFFHDISNMIMGLAGTSELLASEEGRDPQKLAAAIHQMSLRLAREVDIQRCLVQTDLRYYQPVLHEVTVGQIFSELKDIFANHPVAKDRSLLLQETLSDLSFKTDPSLLTRILVNMVKNAFEATEQGGEVKVWLEQGENTISFCVWNRQFIAEPVAKRVFQRNFSTKEGLGRGLGTYAIKLFGEQVLGGRVDFTTSVEAGTVFRFSLVV